MLANRAVILALGLAFLGFQAIAQDKADASAKPEEAKSPITASISAATDYTFRGISQTKNRGALQGTFEYAHESGVYAGVFGSNVKFPDQTGVAEDRTRYEVDLSAGYRFETGPLSWDLGAIAYTYPGEGRRPMPPNTGANDTHYRYYEGQVKATYEAIKEKLSFTLQYNRSPNYYGDSGRTQYYAISSKAALPEDFTVSAGMGRSLIRHNDRFGTQDYYDWVVGIAHPLFIDALVLELRYVDTSVTKGACNIPANGTVCSARGMVVLTYNF